MRTKFGEFVCVQENDILHVRSPLGSIILLDKARIGYVHIRFKKYGNIWEPLCQEHGSSWAAKVGYQLPLEEERNYRWTNAQRDRIVKAIMNELNKVTMPKFIYTYTDQTFDEWNVIDGLRIKGKVVFTIKAESILQADEAFERKTGTNPAKLSYVGCSIKSV